MDAARQDSPSPNYLTGYFTWNDGKGGISWDPNQPTEDPGGPMDRSPTAPAAPLVYEAGNNVRPITGDSMVLPPPEVFESAPLPRAMYINGSRLVQVDMFLEGCGAGHSPLIEPNLTPLLGADDPRLDVEIRVNGTLFTGGVSHANEVYRVVEAPGYCVRSYRMQPEMDYLPLHSVISIKIIHFSQSHPFQYRLAGDFRTVVRIAYFSPDEVLIRVPDFARTAFQNAQDTESKSSPGSGGLHAGIGQVGILGLAGMAFAGASLRRRAALILVCLMLSSVAMAGCAGAGRNQAAGGTAAGPDGKTSSGGSAIVIIDPNNETGLVTERSGAIAGVVVDEQGAPAASAHVSLAGTAFYGDTSVAGRFSFKNLAPGSYHVRVEWPDYKTYENSVPVKAKSVTRVEIVLEPTVTKDLGFRTHRHDEWPENPYTLFESDVKAPMASESAYYWTFPRPGKILPGTQDVEVTLHWDDETGKKSPRRVGIAFQANDYTVAGTHCEAEDCYFAGYTYLFPRESDTPFHIRTTWEMTDPGHTQFTTWPGMVIWVPQRDNGPEEFGPTLTCTGCLGLEAQTFSTIHIKVVLHKGVIPYEAPHPDNWGANLTLPVRYSAKASSTGIFCVQDQTPGGAANLAARCSATPWPATGMVPLGTKWLDATLTQTGKFPTKTFDWSFIYQGANGAGPSQPFPATTKDSTLQTWTYHVPIDPKDVDSPYAKRTSWSFQVDSGNQNGLYADYLATTFGVPRPTLNLTVTAHRDEMPAGGAS